MKRTQKINGGGARIPILLALLVTVLAAMLYVFNGGRDEERALDAALQAGYDQLTTAYMQITVSRQAAPDAETLADAVTGGSGELTTTFTAEPGGIRVEVRDAQGDSVTGIWPMPQ